MGFPKKSKEEHERGSDEPKDEMEITSRPLFFPSIGSPSRTTVNELHGKNTDFDELAQKLQLLLKIQLA